MSLSVAGSCGHSADFRQADRRVPGSATLQEAGFDIPNVPQARGVIGPPSMPTEATKYYSDLFRKLSETQEWNEYLQKAQVQNAFLGSEKTGKFLVDYTNLLRDILKSANVAVIR